MSTVESHVRCPQCKQFTSNIFDCSDSSWDVSCLYCGYRESHGPSGDTWVDRVEPAYGVISVQQHDPRRVIHSISCTSEAVFNEAIARIEGLSKDYLWLRAAKWSNDKKAVELVRDYLAAGHTAPNIFPEGEDEDAEDGTWKYRR